MWESEVNIHCDKANLNNAKTVQEVEIIELPKNKIQKPKHIHIITMIYQIYIY